MLPFSSQATTTTSMPAMTALAGLVPWAETGNQADVAVVVAACVVIGADGEQAGIFALRAGIGLQRDGGKAGDLGQPPLQPGKELAVALRSGRRAQRGGVRPNSGQVTGIISVVALSFMVHEPSGIIEWVSDRSRASSRLM